MVRMIREQWDLTHTIVQGILTGELGMGKSTRKWFQKTFLGIKRITSCPHFLGRIENDLFSGDKFWIFEYDPETKLPELGMVKKSHSAKERSKAQ